jgi:hypothetical protein
MKEWKHYFEDLLNVNSNTFQATQIIPPAPKDLPINQGPITVNDALKAVRQLKNGKYPGLDYVTYAMKSLKIKICQNNSTPTSSYQYQRKVIEL